MSKRVSNKKGKQRVRPGRSGGHAKTPKWVARKPFAFDPIGAIDDLLKR